VATLSFSEEFSLRALSTPLESEEAVQCFADWMSRKAMGENFDEPLVALSYRVDHLLNDCDDKIAAVRLLREELPRLAPICKLEAGSFLQFLSDSR
jgi:hypothetical protein